MIRVNLYLTEEQVAAIKSFKTLVLSEHIRRAVDQYIQKLIKGQTTVSLSKSKKVI